jgi:hypothetical protein
MCICYLNIVVLRAALFFGVTYSAWLFKQKDDPDDTEDEQLA